MSISIWHVDLSISIRYLSLWFCIISLNIVLFSHDHLTTANGSFFHQHILDWIILLIVINNIFILVKIICSLGLLLLDNLQLLLRQGVRLEVNILHSHLQWLLLFDNVRYLNCFFWYRLRVRIITVIQTHHLLSFILPFMHTISINDNTIAFLLLFQNFIQPNI